MAIRRSTELPARSRSIDRLTKYIDLRAHVSGVTALSLTDDERQLVSGSKDGAIILWSLDDREKVQEFVGHSGEVTCIALSPDRKFALSSGSDQAIRMWNLQSGKLVREYVGHVDTVTSVAFHPSGQLFCSSGYDGLRLWDRDKSMSVAALGYQAGVAIPTIELMDDLQQLEGHITYVRSVAYSADGKWILTGGNEALIAVWNIDKRRLLND